MEEKDKREKDDQRFIRIRKNEKISPIDVDIGNDITQNGETTRFKNRKRKRWKNIISVLCAAMVFCTSYSLILPAITLSTDTFCGIEEHEHTDDCYEKVLICNLDSEDETQSQQTEDASLAETESTYIDEESAEEGNGGTDDENDAENDEDEVDGKADNGTDADNDSTQDSSSSQSVNDTASVEPDSEDGNEGDTDSSTTSHVHDESCYEEVLICEQEEHKHSLQCHSNPLEDAETEEDWKATLPETLSENKVEALIQVAESQLGYTESTENYEVEDEENSIIKGYTRYGEWYGGESTRYNDWSGMFVSFVTYYAGITSDNLPGSDYIYKWIEDLESSNVLKQTSDYAAGDILFFKQEDSNGSLQMIAGIITKVTDDSVEVIAGDVDGTVTRVELQQTDSKIYGYVVVIENKGNTTEVVGMVSSSVSIVPQQVTTMIDDAASTAILEDSDTEDEGAETEDDESESENDESDSEDASATVYTYRIHGDQYQVNTSRRKSVYSTRTHGTTETSNTGLDYSVTLKVKDSSGNWQSLNAVNGVYSVSEKDTIAFYIDFTLLQGTLTAEGLTYRIKLPDALLVNDAYFSGDQYDGSTRAFKYTTENGYLVLTFYEDYIENNNNSKNTGHIILERKVSELMKEEKITESYAFDGDSSFTVTINDKEKKTSDLRITKAAVDGSLNVENGTIQYTVTVHSENGTSENISLEDTITNASLYGPITISYKGETYSVPSDSDSDSVVVASNVQLGSSSFSLNLAPLGADEDYVLTYTVQATDYQTSTSCKVGNKIIGHSKDKSYEPIGGSAEPDVITITTDLIEKEGRYIKDENGEEYIEWTITVNEEHQNIDGYWLEDALNGVAPFSGTVKIERYNQSGNLITTLTDRELPFIFSKDEGATELRDKYVITYRTSADREVGNSEVFNYAYLTNGSKTYQGDDSVDVNPDKTKDSIYNPVSKEAGETYITEDGKLAIPWTITIDISEGPLRAETLVKDAGYNGNAKHYLTYSDAVLLAKKLEEIFDATEIRFNCADDKWWVSQWYTYDSETQSIPLYDQNISGFTYWEFKVGKDIDKSTDPIVLNLITYADIPTEEDTYTYKNEFYINDGAKAEDQVTKRVGPSDVKWAKVDVKGSGASTSHTENDDGMYFNGQFVPVLQWQIEIELPEDYSGGDLIVTDSLPEGLTLWDSATQGNYVGEHQWPFKAYITQYSNDQFKNIESLEINLLETDPDGITRVNVTLKDSTTGQNTDFTYTITGTYNEETGEIQVTVPAALIEKAGIKQLDFQMKCFIENYSSLKAFEKTSFTNTASLKDSNKTVFESSTDTQTQTITKGKSSDLVDKSASAKASSEHPYTTYQIKINKNGEDLDSSSNTLTVEDELYYQMISGSTVNEMDVSLDSLKVYNLTSSGEKGNELDSSQYQYQVNESYAIKKVDGNDKFVKIYTLTIVVPDSMPLLIEYTYKSMTGDNISEGITLYNTANVKGYGEKVTPNTIYAWVPAYKSSSTISSDSFMLVKQDADQQNLLLSGAEFLLEEWDGHDWVEVDTYTTGINGMVSIPNIKDNVAYRLTEVKAPGSTGEYVLNSVPIEFYSGYSDLDKLVKPAGFNGTAIDLGSKFYVDNTNAKTSIQVQKQWIDKDGNEIDNPGFTSFDVSLHRATIVESILGEDGSAETVDTQTGYAYLFKQDRAQYLVSGTVGSTATITFTYTEPWDGAGDPQLSITNITKGQTVPLEPDITGDSYPRTYTYEFEITIGEFNVYLISRTVDTGWNFDANVSEVTRAGETYDIPLMTDEEYKTITLRKSNGWVATENWLKNLPRAEIITRQAKNKVTGEMETVQVLVKYMYYVVEPESTVYVRQDSSNPISIGTIYLTNKLTGEIVETYTLPETGGAGTMFFTSTGSVCIAASCLCGYFSRKKKQQKPGGDQ